MQRKIVKGLTDAKERTNPSKGNGSVERSSNRGFENSNRDLKHYILAGPEVRVVYELYTSRIRVVYDNNTTFIQHNKFLVWDLWVDLIHVTYTGLSSRCC